MTKGALQGQSITYNDYFNESSDEGSYIESSEDEDSVDSDFVTEESADDDDDDAEEEVRESERADKRKAKKGAYMDPAKRLKSGAKAAADSDSDSDSKPSGKGAAASGGRRRAPTESTPTDRKSLRGSTAQRSASSKKAAEEEERKRALMPKTRPQQEERRLTQEELLEEAKLTAAENAKDLERLVRIEEEMSRVDWARAPITGPRVIFLSTKATNVITFSDPDLSVLAEWEDAQAPLAAKKAVCAITGQPAKYRDPLTGHAYATAAAFKKIREKAS